MDKENKSSTKEILYDGKLYDVSKFLKRHPGGRIIEFYLNGNEDATEAINQFHARSNSRFATIVKSFKSRPADTKKNRKYQALSEDFDKLFNEIQAEGLLEPSLTHSLWRISEIILLGLLGSVLVINSGNLFSTCLGTLICSLCTLRGGYLGHEAGHFALVGNVTADRFILDVIYGLTNGISGSWWRSQHNRHHAMPQRLKHDVDLNTHPLFAWNVAVVENKPLTWTIRHQTKLLLPFLSCIGVLRWRMPLCPKYAISKGNYHELVFIGIHYIIAYQIGVVSYLFSTALSASFFVLTFALSHSHLPVTNEPRHWVEYSLVHSINIHSNWFVDWWTGFLNFQIEHHLFPTVPHFRHAQIKQRVKELAEKHNLPYVCIPYVEAVKIVFKNLSKVSDDLEKLETNLEEKMATSDYCKTNQGLRISKL